MGLTRNNLPCFSVTPEKPSGTTSKPVLPEGGGERVKVVDIAAGAMVRLTRRSLRFIVADFPMYGRFMGTRLFGRLA